MRHSLVLSVLLLAGSCATVKVASLTAKPDPVLAIDGKRRAIRITLGRGVDDDQSMYRGDRFGAGGWRTFVGQAFTDALGKSFVVVTTSGPDVLELRIQRASARLDFRGRTGTPQIRYAASLADASGQVLGRTSGTARGTLSGTGFSDLDETGMENAREALSQMLASAVEELVQRTGAELLPRIPESVPPSELLSSWMYVDSPAPADDVLCDAEALPEWQTAVAARKRELLRSCQR